MNNPESSSAINKKTVSWAFYDVANSAFATSVMAGFFPILFKNYWSSGMDPSWTTARLALAHSIASIIIAGLAPVLGRLSDQLTNKKKWLAICASMGSVMTGALAFIQSGQWVWAVICFILAAIGFSAGNVFYDALLPHICTRKQLNQISSLGYALGYLGGGALFSIHVFMVMSPSSFGLASQAIAIKTCFITVAIWWGLFSIPLMVFTKERTLKPPKKASEKGTLIASIVTIFKSKRIGYFLLAYWLYIDGVHTVIRMAIDYGLSIGFQTHDLIIALCLIQWIGLPATLLFGKIATHFRTINGIFLGLSVYIIITIWGTFMSTKWEFYGIAILIGCAQGGIQALSRSYFASLIPQGKEGEWFGVYNMIGRYAVIFGPLLVGSVALCSRSLGYTAMMSARISIISILIFFISGAACLYASQNSRSKPPH